MTDSETIQAAFQDLREFCDPRGHGILDALERLYLTELDIRHVRELKQRTLAEIGSTRRMISHLSDLDGYSLDDPKRAMLENGRPW